MVPSSKKIENYQLIFCIGKYYKIRYNLNSELLEGKHDFQKNFIVVDDGFINSMIQKLAQSSVIVTSSLLKKTLAENFAVPYHPFVDLLYGRLRPYISLKSERGCSEIVDLISLLTRCYNRRPSFETLQYIQVEFCELMKVNSQTYRLNMQLLIDPNYCWENLNAGDTLIGYCDGDRTGVD
jgi:hypothetical protein